ncbi:hypothetical protein [uncultured Sphingomonas sp.]|uniref:hypothetical protein n=1 Tax=uncultured Sphingomonas sp. TaxID=158754 RepID=UPI00258D0A86|nr:hypothetical protein [uncultured Sphingomonas sp.]
MIRHFPRRMLLALLLVVAGATPAAAWDGTTHEKITNLAIDHVRDPALKAFLRKHRDTVLSAADFPDWGHYLKPHGDVLHLRWPGAVWDHIRRQGASANPDLIAQAMGAWAHIAEDRMLDATVKAARCEVGECTRDDMELGLLVPSFYPYTRDYRIVRPDADIAAIYAEQRYFGDPRLNGGSYPDTIADGLGWLEAGRRKHKLLSFLTGDWARRAFPWAAANVLTAPGGVQSQAAAVARGWEADWAALHERPAPVFVATIPSDGGHLTSLDPRSAFGQILVLSRRNVDFTKLSPVTLTDAAGKAIPVTLRPYIPESGTAADFAFMVVSTQPWAKGRLYTLSVPVPYGSAGEPLVVRFKAQDGSVFARPSAATPRPWRFGLFLFGIVGGTGLLLLGAPSALQLSGRSNRPATGALATRVVGAVLLAIGLYLLITDGGSVIAFLRVHH